MSESIRLVKNGVFPIVNDENGNLLNNLPLTGYDFAGTIQGEGKLIGIPVLFIRTSGCNLRCIWRLPDGQISVCDTAESSFDTRESVTYDFNHIINLLKHNLGEIKHIVISGGEPFLQRSSLVALCRMIKETFNVHITVETNGTVFLSELIDYVDLFSISPKLKGSVPDTEKLFAAGYSAFEDYIQLHQKRRLNINALQNFIDQRGIPPTLRYDIQFKFVVSNISEVDEIHELMNHLKNVKQEDIILMPLGSDYHSLEMTQKIVAAMAIKNGWRFSSRLHIDLFTNLPGV